MRERITIAFVVLALAVLLGAGTVRAFTLRDLLREQDATHLRHDAVLIGQLISDQRALGEEVDEEFLSTVVEPSARVRYVDEDGESIVVRGETYEGVPKEDVTASATSDLGTVTLSTKNKGIGDVFGRDLGSIITLFLLIGVLAGVIGWIAARALAGPFQKLAVAAGALGRGRFDLELPKTRIPEALAISNALRASAHQLEDRVHRERDFAEHASHVLRTPLTGLRLELEDLTLRDDVPDDVKESAARSLASVEQVGTVAAELVDLTRRGSLVEGSELPLVDLATQLAQRWADRLGARNRTLTAAAEGDLDLAFTPGPVEHVLDLVLSDILLGGKGPVRITFLGEDDYLKVTMPAGVIAHGSRRRRGPQPGAGLEAARVVATSQGGRIAGDGSAEDLEILLPRR